MIEIEACIGKRLAFVPVSAVPFLHSGQRYLIREYKRVICEMSTTNSYREATSAFNKRFNRNGDEALKRNTYVHDVIACGNDLIEAKRKVTAERLIAYGFNPDTCEYEHGELPEALRNHLPDKVTVSPSTGVTAPPSDEWNADNPNQEIPSSYLYVHEKGKRAEYSDEAAGTLTDPNEESQTEVQETEGTGSKEYSQPDNDTTKYVSKRRGKRVEVAPEKKQGTVDQYVQWRNEHVKSPISKILYGWDVEVDTSEVVYISSDADLVPKQDKIHVKGGKPERKNKGRSEQKESDEPLNVNHWDIKVEWDGFSYGITGIRKDVYRELLVFLIENGLINRYLVFFSDGERIIFDDIGYYFRYWHYVIYLDYFHLQHKAYEYLSQAIKHIKMADPRETPEYYKRGPKKGQLKQQKEIFMSVAYSRVVSSALFAGNWKESILYLRNINPDHVDKPSTFGERGIISPVLPSGRRLVSLTPPIPQRVGTTLLYPGLRRERVRTGGKKAVMPRQRLKPVSIMARPMSGFLRIPSRLRRVIQQSNGYKRQIRWRQLHLLTQLVRYEGRAPYM